MRFSCYGYKILAFAANLLPEHVIQLRMVHCRSVHLLSIEKHFVDPRILDGHQSSDGEVSHSQRAHKVSNRSRRSERARS